TVTRRRRLHVTARAWRYRASGHGQEEFRQFPGGGMEGAVIKVQLQEAPGRLAAQHATLQVEWQHPVPGTADVETLQALEGRLVETRSAGKGQGALRSKRGAISGSQLRGQGAVKELRCLAVVELATALVGAQ